MSYEEVVKEFEVVENFLKSIDIPYIKGSDDLYVLVDGRELYDILTDEGKLKTLICKIKNKAFL